MDRSRSDSIVSDSDLPKILISNNGQGDIEDRLLDSLVGAIDSPPAATKESRCMELARAGLPFSEFKAAVSPPSTGPVPIGNTPMDCTPDGEALQVQTASDVGRWIETVVSQGSSAAAASGVHESGSDSDTNTSNGDAPNKDDLDGSDSEMSDVDDVGEQQPRGQLNRPKKPSVPLRERLFKALKTHLSRENMVIDRDVLVSFVKSLIRKKKAVQNRLFSYNQSIADQDVSKVILDNLGVPYEVDDDRIHFTDMPKLVSVVQTLLKGKKSRSRGTRTARDILALPENQMFTLLKGCNYFMAKCRQSGQEMQCVLVTLLDFLKVVKPNGLSNGFPFRLTHEQRVLLMKLNADIKAEVSARQGMSLGEKRLQDRTAIGFIIYANGDVQVEQTKYVGTTSTDAAKKFADMVTGMVVEPRLGGCQLGNANKPTTGYFAKSFVKVSNKAGVDHASDMKELAELSKRRLGALFTILPLATKRAKELRDNPQCMMQLQGEVTKAIGFSTSQSTAGLTFESLPAIGCAAEARTPVDEIRSHAVRQVQEEINEQLALGIVEFATKEAIHQENQAQYARLNENNKEKLEEVAEESEGTGMTTDPNLQTEAYKLVAQTLYDEKFAVGEFGYDDVEVDLTQLNDSVVNEFIDILVPVRDQKTRAIMELEFGSVVEYGRIILENNILLLTGNIYALVKARLLREDEEKLNAQRERMVAFASGRGRRKRCPPQRLIEGN